MASGIDISARMISLAVNIALMGFILVQGTLSSLRASVTGPVNEEQLRVLAQTISAGSVNGVGQGAALAHGFGWVMVYGAMAAWLLMAASLWVFRDRTVVAAQA